MATDNGFPQKSATTVLRVTVTDENDNCPTFTEPFPNHVFEVDETQSIGGFVAKVSAVDLDSGINGAIVYDISTSDMFSIDPDKGLIIVASKLVIRDLRSYGHCKRWWWSILRDWYTFSCQSGFISNGETIDHEQAPQMRHPPLLRHFFRPLTPTERLKTFPQVRSWSVWSGLQPNMLRKTITRSGEQKLEIWRLPNVAAEYSRCWSFGFLGQLVSTLIELVWTCVQVGTGIKHSPPGHRFTNTESILNIY